MAFLILTPNRNTARWEKELKQIDETIDIRIWPDCGNTDEIDFVLVWNHPRGELLKFKNLKCIASLGAGVDHIFKDPNLPKGVKITRVVDPLLSQSMDEYVLMMVLNIYRRYDQYKEIQKQKNWTRIPISKIYEFRVGVMGLGEMGGNVAKKLAGLGFQVVGWSEPQKKIEGITNFQGASQFEQFLQQSNILICLLPLTPKTKDILNLKTFNQLPKGAYIINVARGEHLVEEDLIKTLDSDQLSGACLDVYRQEPLPPDHLFWEHPKIILTPHIASITDPKSVVAQVMENYHRLQKGQELLFEVDVSRGY